MSKKGPSNDMDLFQEILNKARRIVVISGAGISAESGIPTFRGEGGLWRNYQAPALATLRAFKKDPSLVWEFYHYRRELVLTKKPNLAHSSLAILEKQILEQKKDRRLTVITQNIDGLHQAAGSQNVIEIHGSLFKTQCIPCGDIAENRNSPICEALRDRGAPDLKEDLPKIPLSDLPRCQKPGCGGLLRPYVVWFGENLHEEALYKANEAIEYCDLCLVVGTSSIVYPAAMWGYKLAEQGITVAEFNMEHTPHTSYFKFHFNGQCTKTLPDALEIAPNALRNV